MFTMCYRDQREKFSRAHSSGTAWPQCCFWTKSDHYFGLKVHSRINSWPSNKKSKANLIKTAQISAATSHPSGRTTLREPLFPQGGEKLPQSLRNLCKDVFYLMFSTWWWSRCFDLDVRCSETVTHCFHVLTLTLARVSKYCFGQEVLFCRWGITLVASPKIHRTSQISQSSACVRPKANMTMDNIIKVNMTSWSTW